MELLATRLSEQSTLAKSLVISAMKHALSGWLCITLGLDQAVLVPA